MVSKARWTAAYRRDIENLEIARAIASTRATVFIAIDVKWDETDPDTILEIGVAVLDVREGHLRPNRYPPSTWSIRPRHIIITENVYVHNSQHVRSNKFGFKFGKSYFARLEKAVKSLQSILDSYPQVAVVGQFCSRDKTILEDIGLYFNPTIQIFDTANLDRAYTRQWNGARRSLRTICEDLEIPYYRPDKLDNAGNDAFFAMAIFAEMCCVSED
jgi:hypothetical protein